MCVEVLKKLFFRRLKANKLGNIKFPEIEKKKKNVFQKNLRFLLLYLFLIEKEKNTIFLTA